jgi:membrane associated rhomboid family serine protease
VNIVVFLHEANLGPALDRFLLQYGFVPAVYFHLSYVEPLNVPARLLPMLTSMFLHGGLLHLLGNMWMLWIFGNNVEERLGRGWFLAYYLVCGIAACYVHYLTGPRSGIPVVGASGAIAGVMGGYFVLFPRAKILTLLPIFIFIQIVTVPAIIFFAFWFLVQLLNGMVASAASFGGGVAWWAHVGGFIAGAILILPKSRPRYGY